MKHIILIILVICTNISKSECQEKITDTNNNAIMMQLKNAYLKQDYNTFWKQFPDNFQQFMYCYGFENYEKGNLSLYWLHDLSVEKGGQPMKQLKAHLFLLLRKMVQFNHLIKIKLLMEL